MAVTDTLRAAGINAYPPPDAPVHRPRYTGALFPTLDNVYDGFFVDLAPGEHSGSGARRRSPVTARSCSTTAGSTPRTSPHTGATGPWMRSSSRPEGTYELILGPDDPDHVNWIDTGGLSQGIFAIRCLLPEQRYLPDVEVIRRSGPGRGVGPLRDGTPSPS